MIDSSEARAKIFAGIRAALQTGSLAPEIAPSTKWAEIARPYRRTSTLSHAESLHLLTDRLLDYDAQVVHATAATLPSIIAQQIAARGLEHVLIPAGIPAKWLPGGVEFTVDEQFSAAELNRYDGVLTGATLAIAETGTLVLQNVAAQGRRAATLVPDYHLCVLRTEDVVATVPEAMDRLHATATLPTTFVSGPSATADIEMTRIKGVHGPRFLDVILLSPA